MRLLSSRFSPRLVEPELLEQLLVGRGALLERLVDNHAAAIASGHGRFDLIVGPRGVGKSHMLGLVEARLRAHPQLQERVVIVALPEEFHPSSLLHLLARVLEALPAGEMPVETQLRLLRGKDASEAIDMAVAMIRGRLQGRALLVMLENLDTIFADLGRKAQAQLRKIVQTEAGWSMFATACSAVALTKQSEPFHGTFVVEPLDMLSPSDCREMMLRLAQVHEHEVLIEWLASEDALVHVRAAHHLLGGSPRVIAMLFYHLDPDHLDDFEGNFFRLAEEVTPYFQEQMGRLSPGQRPVMEFLAERWCPASVTEIAEATFVPATTVSTHLRALRNHRLVQAMAVGKERYYEIADPLHRVARAMKRDRRLGAAIAHMARVWALLGAREVSADSTLGRLVEFCETNAEYVRALLEQLDDGDLEEMSRRIDALMPHVQGHPRQNEMVICLMILGRDIDALANIEVMIAAGRGIHILELAIIAPSYCDAKRCPAAMTALTRYFDQIIDEHTNYPGHLCVATQISEGTRFIDQRFGPLYAKFDDIIMVAIIVIAWCHDEFEILVNSQSLAERREQSLTKGKSEIHAALFTCLHQLHEASRSHVPVEATPLLEICVALWIASGRDLALLRQIVPKDIPYSFMHALTAPDNGRAFSLLGAEVRLAIRQLLAASHLHDLLAALPPEPTLDPL